MVDNDDGGGGGSDWLPFSWTNLNEPTHTTFRASKPSGKILTNRDSSMIIFRRLRATLNVRNNSKRSYRCVLNFFKQQLFFFEQLYLVLIILLCLYFS